MENVQNSPLSLKSVMACVGNEREDCVLKYIRVDSNGAMRKEPNILRIMFEGERVPHIRCGHILMYSKSAGREEQQESSSMAHARVHSMKSFTATPTWPGNRPLPNFQAPIIWRLRDEHILIAVIADSCLRH